MADFNKISVNSSLTVIPASFASLCFNDGLVISKSKYTIVNHILDLLVDSTDTVSIFSNNGIATTYEFEYIRLNVPGVTLPATDINRKPLKELVPEKTLIFVDGKLQPSSTYTIINGDTIKFNINYTNDYNKLFNIYVYSSRASFQRFGYTKADLTKKYNESTEIIQEDLKQNRIVLPVTYSHKNTLLFIDGRKIAFNAIDIFDSMATTVQLNIPESILDNVERLEIIKFTDDSTNSVNFTTKQGYLTYGPYDDLGKKLSNTYDVIFKFTDQAKLLIDNLRAGFILKEEDGYGEAIIVDDNFESFELKALLIQPFPYSSYTSNKYYLQVPEYTTITNYLAQFDRKYTFLPEILTIFQSILLDEINDTIQRLRDARSINKVDSNHINKLISLLGFDINIKQLNKKQRRELIEELNEFYRIAGTRNSYNLINILQNNLKLINAEQLFTPAGKTQSKQKLFGYKTDISSTSPGKDYQIGDALAVENTGLIVRVNDVDEKGALTSIELETAEGYNPVNGVFGVKSILNGSFKAESVPNKYTYDWMLRDSVDLAPGILLQNSTKTYGVRIKSIDGKSISFDRYSKTHDPYTDKFRVDFNNLQLYRLVDEFTATVNSEPIYNGAQTSDISGNRITDDLYTIPKNLCTPEYTVYSVSINNVELDPSKYYVAPDFGMIHFFDKESAPKNTDSVLFTAKFFEYEFARDEMGNPHNYIKGGQEVTTILKPGVYYIKTSGGGGAGSASYSTHTGGLYMENGNGGEAKDFILNIKEPTSITCKVGQGGGKVYATGWEASPNKEVKGAGYQPGELGQQHHKTGSVRVHHGWHKHREKQNWGNSIGGQGGGSSAILNIKGETLIVARGGNGGNAKNYDGGFVKGGTGGSGGIVSGIGAAGGSYAKSAGWSEGGKDGWIKIYKIPVKYSINVNGDLSVAGDEVWHTVESGLENLTQTEREKAGITKEEFKITTKYAGGTTTYSFEPETGYYGCYGTFNLTAENDNSSAKLSIASTVGLWDYYVKLTADPTYITKNSTFINSDSPVDEQFIYTITKNNSTEGTWTPKQGTKKITLNNVPAKTRQGSGAKIVVSSTENVQNKNRCYIDFYKKEELFDKSKGEGQWIEFRPDTIPHGTITEGTPNSPKPWEVGEPDIKYGTINDEATEFISYGTITEKTNGEWVEWWKWDRKKNYYPTNHVDLEMKLPPGVNFSEYVNTFIEQFYNLASAVVFIHQITEAFYFGNDTNTNPNTTVNTTENLIGDAGALGAPFGIVSTMPTVSHELTVTSDPNRQYINPIADKHKVTITSNISNSHNEIIIETVGNDGKIIPEVIVLDATNNWTTDIPYGTTITYKVEAPNYITTIDTLVITKDIRKRVVLKPQNPVEPKYCLLTINTIPENAYVAFKTNNITTTTSHTIGAWAGNVIDYTVAYPNYVMQTGSLVLTTNRKLDIQLEPGVLFTVQTIPADAKVTFVIDNKVQTGLTKTYLQQINALDIMATSDINYPGYQVNIVNQVYAPINKEFTYTVSKPGYKSQTITATINAAAVVKVNLEKES